MNTLIWLFSLLLASPNVGYNQQTGSNLNSIEPNIEIKYERMFQTNDGIDNGLYLRFSTAFKMDLHVRHLHRALSSMGILPKFAIDGRTHITICKCSHSFYIDNGV